MRHKKKIFSNIYPRIKSLFFKPVKYHQELIPSSLIKTNCIMEINGIRLFLDTVQYQNPFIIDLNIETT